MAKRQSAEKAKQTVVILRLPEQGKISKKFTASDGVAVFDGDNLNADWAEECKQSFASSGHCEADGVQILDVWCDGEGWTSPLVASENAEAREESAAQQKTKAAVKKTAARRRSKPKK